MVSKLLLPVLLFFYCTSCAQTEYRVMAVGFYNCENFFDTLHDPQKKDDAFTPSGFYHYTDAVYKQKLHNIAAVIEKMGTDITPDGPAILGMTEIENGNILTDLADQPEIRNRHYKYACFHSNDNLGLTTALLYNPKYLQVQNAEQVHVPTESLPAKKRTRDILHVYGVMAGDTVHIFINHWPGRTPGDASGRNGRMLAATILKRMTDSLLTIRPNIKILLLGDFNDNPKSDEIADALKAKARQSDVSLTDIYNPWINMYKKGSGTENYHDEWYLTDQIMLSGAFIVSNNNKWKFHRAEIYDRDFLENKTGRHKGLPHNSFTAAHVWDNGYSNHFPVLIYLVEKRTAAP
jgi:endonuclease/exonuclease/phosphatase family metal-dependent hydrolase